MNNQQGIRRALQWYTDNGWRIEEAPKDDNNNDYIFTSPKGHIFGSDNFIWNICPICSQEYEGIEDEEYPEFCIGHSEELTNYIKEARNILNLLALKDKDISLLCGLQNAR